MPDTPDGFGLRDVFTVISALSGLLVGLISWYVIAKGKAWKEEIINFLTGKMDAQSKQFTAEIEKTEARLESQLKEIKTNMVTKEVADIRFKNMEQQIDFKLGAKKNEG